MKTQLLRGFTVACLAGVYAACGASNAQQAQTQQPVAVAIQAPSPAGGGPAKVDVGTPAGAHVLGPLAAQAGTPDYSIIQLDWDRSRELCNPGAGQGGGQGAAGGQGGPTGQGGQNQNQNAPPPDPKRDPGPIRANGALTFFGLPIAVTPEDLKAGKVEVAIIGAPLDTGVGFRGAGEGPNAFRASRGGGGSMETMVSWRSELKGVDYGNAAIDPFSIERSVPCVRKKVFEIAQTGAIPIIIGGDHSLEYPNVAALADVYGKENVGVIHFDSHYDAGDGRQGHLIWHGAPVRRLVDDGHVLGKNYIQVGLRGGWPGPEGFEWMRKNNFRYHTMAEIDHDGWPAVMQRVLKEANDGPKYLHISFDIDVLDPAYTSGTGTPVPGGLTPREVFPLIRNLCAEKNMAGFDLVELDPLVDPGYTSALNAKEVVNSCLTGIALRKKGLAPNYLSPLTLDDNRR
jgi:arginase family enzyme